MYILYSILLSSMIDFKIMLDLTSVVAFRAGDYCISDITFM